MAEGKIIKIYLDRHTLEILEKDMEAFNIIKKNSLNKSKMGNMIFKALNSKVEFEQNEMLEFFMKEIKEKTLSKKFILKKEHELEISNNLKEIHRNIIKNYFDTKVKNIKIKDFFYFRLNNENSEYFEILENEYPEEKINITIFFRRLFLEYSKYSQYEREKLLFKESYDNLKKAIKNSNYINIKIMGLKENIKCRPLDIKNNKDEQNNYLITSNELEIRTVKLCKIERIFISHEKFEKNSIENKFLLEIDKEFDPFTLNKDRIKLRLTQNGELLYKRLQHNRPKIEKIDNNIYTLTTSKDKVFSYFFKFGRDVEILEPKDLRERFKNELIETLNNYSL
ncbi:MAG: WYL domain-containing protein [Cetobacterium sp.]